jgi:hypothetical protein
MARRYQVTSDRGIDARRGRRGVRRAGSENEGGPQELPPLAAREQACSVAANAAAGVGVAAPGLLRGSLRILSENIHTPSDLNGVGYVFHWYWPRCGEAQVPTSAALSLHVNTDSLDAHMAP